MKGIAVAKPQDSKNFPTITSERLVGQPLLPEHGEVLSELLNEPEVAQWLGGIPTPEAIVEQLDNNARRWTELGFGYWLLRDRSTGAVVGRGGLSRVEIEGISETEVGYLVAPEYWNQGFATEMGELFIKVAFEKLGLKDLVGFTLPNNARSRRVLEKLGFIYERDFNWKGYDSVLYRRSVGP